jgi:hypothetical protein
MGGSFRGSRIGVVVKYHGAGRYVGGKLYGCSMALIVQNSNQFHH